VETPSTKEVRGAPGEALGSDSLRGACHMIVMREGKLYSE
jgi:hypothetical protein